MYQMLKKYQLPISLVLLLIFYSVGLAGMLFSENPQQFAKLSWLNLIISATVLFFNHKKWSPVAVWSILVVGVLGFLAEVAGVQTGAIFGEYAYGKALGFKLFDVPLVIALNWAMLCYFSVYTFGIWIKSWWLNAIVAAASLVALDVIIEPVAIKLDFWNWSAAEIPLQNFVAWFVLAIFFNTLIALAKKDSENKIAPYLFLIQLIFFTILRLAL